MTAAEIMKLENPIVMCADGRMGMLVRYPSEAHPDFGKPMAGVQVSGEEDIRWISPHRLTDLGDGALIESAEVSG